MEAIILITWIMFYLNFIVTVNIPIFLGKNNVEQTPQQNSLEPPEVIDIQWQKTERGSVRTGAVPFLQ